MPVELSKGGNAPLSATTVLVDLQGDVHTDVSALLLTEQGRVRDDADFVFYTSRRPLGRAPTAYGSGAGRGPDRPARAARGDRQGRRGRVAGRPARADRRLSRSGPTWTMTALGEYADAKTARGMVDPAARRL